MIVCNFVGAAKQVEMVWACFKKDENVWVKKCIVYDVEGVGPRGRPKKTYREVVDKDCQIQQIKEEDAMDYRKRKKLRKDIV